MVQWGDGNIDNSRVGTADERACGAARASQRAYFEAREEYEVTVWEQQIRAARRRSACALAAAGLGLVASVAGMVSQTWWFAPRGHAEWWVGGAGGFIAVVLLFYKWSRDAERAVELANDRLATTRQRHTLLQAGLRVGDAETLTLIREALVPTGASPPPADAPLAVELSPDLEYAPGLKRRALDLGRSLRGRSRGGALGHRRRVAREERAPKRRNR